jgi:hypothetical protein
MQSNQFYKNESEYNSEDEEEAQHHGIVEQDGFKSLQARALHIVS